MQWFEYKYTDFPEVIAKRNLGCATNQYWHPHVQKMLQALLDNNIYAQIVQIKEKYGELRVYYDNPSSEAEAYILDAAKACSETCAECGAHEDVRNHSSENQWWMLPRCNSCRI
jgi:hypothetical protein